MCVWLSHSDAISTHLKSSYNVFGGDNGLRFSHVTELILDDTENQKVSS